MAKEIPQNLNSRYQKHRGEIGRCFFGGEDPGEITGVFSKGDSHLHGETVSRIETSCGRALYYKPRDCGSTDLLGEITLALFGERMAPEQVTGEGYAFQKALKQRSPGTTAERTGYYRRLGKLTAVFYALGSTDMHGGNILCEGGRPAAVDTETLLCARVEGVGGAGEFSADYGEVFPDLRTSVGECMVLPRFYSFRQTSPLLLDEGGIPEGCDELFLRGFEEGYLRIGEKREEVFRLLDRYKDTPFRYLLRSTQSYAARIQLYNRAKDGTAKEKVLKGLEKGLSPADRKRWAPVLAWERECICEGDIPYFCILAGGKDLMGDLSGRPLIPHYLEQTPVEYAKWRISRMGEEDLAVQKAYARAGLKHTDIRESGKPPSPSSAAALPEEEPLGAEEAVREAEEALSRLRDERIPLTGGGCLWHTPMIEGRVGSMFGLGEGFSGTAVFIRACAESPLITGGAAELAAELSAACFRSMAAFGEYLLNAYPEPPEERVIDRRFNGGFDFRDGLAGFLWALGRCRGEAPETADCIRQGFRSWHIDPGPGTDRELLKRTAEASAPREGGPEGLSAVLALRLRGIDCLEGGNAGKAAALLQEAEETPECSAALGKAGIILNGMQRYRKQAGCFRVFPAGRRQYFLPAFLRGSTGIAYVMLRYAEHCRRI